MSIIDAPNFTLDEFRRASDVDLTPATRMQAEWHARRLQRVRNAINATWAAPEVGGEWQVHVTSFVRSRDVGRDHGIGGGLDWNVRDRAGNRVDTLTRWGRDWLAESGLRDEFAELIYEPAFAEDANRWAHVHHTRRGFSPDDAFDEPTEVLDKTAEGGFVEAAIQLIPAPALPIALAGALAGLAFLVLRS